MKYTPSPDGKFDGHSGYGYKSFEAFVDAVHDFSSGAASMEDISLRLALAQDTLQTTAVLEAGYLSLKEKKQVEIKYSKDGQPVSLEILG